MPTKIEQVVHSRMSTQKPLRLFHRFEPPHTPLSHSSRLVRQLTSIVGILSCLVNRI